MKKYHVPVRWTVSAVEVIEANSLKEAISMAHIRPLPKNHSYVRGSFEANEEEARSLSEIMNKVSTPILKNNQ